MIEIVRWFLGFSEFKIEGDFNNFLSKFQKNIWLVRKRGKLVTSRCMTKDYRYLNNESIYCGCFITKFRDFGFLNFLKKYRFRFGLCVGVLVFFLAIFISNLFVWNVEVNGNALVSDEQVFKVCDENGLHFGSFIGNIDEKDIEFKLKEKFPEISWVSLNRVAGKYVIEISESKRKPEIVNFEGPGEIVSNFDGEVVYVEAYSGTPLVNVGDVIHKGQLLVSSVEEIKGRDNVIISPSSAKIIAKVRHKNEIHCNKNSVIDQKTGIQKFEKSFSLFGLKIPLKLNRKDKKVVKCKEIYKPLKLLGIRFPILMQTTVYDVYETVNLANDIKNIKRVLASEEKKWELNEFMGSKILNRFYNFEENDDEVVLKSELLVEQRVDKKVPLDVESVQSRLESKKSEDEE